jgi:phosphoribosylglycinamide formyltransferase 2
VVPTARAARLTMDREGIRRLAAETLGLPTSPFRFVDTEAEYREAVAAIGLPCVVKPVMSSSGKGQSTVRRSPTSSRAWDYAQSGGRAGQGRAIVEGFVDFDYEITLLTVRHRDGVAFCEPVGHLQRDGDYRESWQPQPMSDAAARRGRAHRRCGHRRTRWLGRVRGGVFVKGDQVWFSEVSPRPHDTGMVTMISQELSQFALHARAILGLPVPPIRLLRPAFSVALLGHGDGVPEISGLDRALAVPESQVRWFGKPECRGHRRLGVVVATGDTVDEARDRARQCAGEIVITLR